MIEAFLTLAHACEPVHCLHLGSFIMQTRILGTTMPVLDVQLEPNESVFSESGELSWMTASIQMTTHTQIGGIVGSILGGDK